MKKVLITGASGFIGSFLVDEALSRGHEVYASLRSTSSRKYLTDKRIKFLELDLSDEERLTDQLVLNKNTAGVFDFIIHNAGITKAKQSDDFFTVNYKYTKHLVSAVRKSNCIGQKFIYISSLAAFGPGTGTTPVRLTDIPRPVTAYGASKLQTEKYLHSLKDFPSLVIRPAAVYGPRDKAFLVLFKLIQNRIEPYIGNDRQLLSFIYVGDLAKAVLTAMESSFLNRSWFISDGFDYTTRTFNSIIKSNLKRKTLRVVIPTALVKPAAYSAKAISSMLGKIATFSPERIKELQAENWLCDTEPSKRELGFSPEHNLHSGLKETVRWYADQHWL